MKKKKVRTNECELFDMVNNHSKKVTDNRNMYYMVNRLNTPAIKIQLDPVEVKNPSWFGYWLITFTSVGMWSLFFVLLYTFR